MRFAFVFLHWCICHFVFCLCICLIKWIKSKHDNKIRNTNNIAVPVVIQQNLTLSIYVAPVFNPGFWWDPCWSSFQNYVLCSSLSCVLCTQCCQFLLYCSFLIARSVFSNVYLSCDLYPILPVSLFLWIIHS